MQKIYIGVVDGKVVLIQGIYDSDFETHQQANPSITFIENTFGLTEVDGYLYDAKKKTVTRDPDWTPPAPPPAPVASRDIHPVALYERFTFAERVGITRAGQINPSDPAEKQTLAATVSRFEKDLSVYKRPINLDGEGLAKGLALLNSIKVLEPDWQARIVQAAITDDERRYGQA